MDEATFFRLRDLLQSRSGLHFKPEQRDEFVIGVQEAMIATGFHDYSAYYQALMTTPNEHPIWKQLVNQLTIGETYFFRNNWQFKALREEVLPSLIEKRRRAGDLSLRLWSAGCATGEEAYSLAILLHELLPDLELWNILVLATDINEQSLAKAQIGYFSNWAFRNETPFAIREKYFLARRNLYEIVPEIRRMVRFDYLNLVEDSYPSAASETLNMDVILCRNVTIYFDRPTTQRIVDRFYQSLVEGGWLVVGHSEPLASIYKAYEIQNFTNTIFYRKPLSGKADMAPPAAAELLAQKVLDLPPSNPFSAREQAERLDEISRLMGKGNFDEARRKLSSFLEMMPDHEEALFLLAKLTADEGQFNEVHDLLDTLEQVNPLLPQAHYLRAIVYQQNQLPDQAKAALRRALYADREFVLAHYMLGELFYTEGNTAMAQRSWQNALNALKKQPPSSLVPFGDGTMVGTLVHAIEQRLSKL